MPPTSMWFFISSKILEIFENDFSTKIKRTLYSSSCKHYLVVLNMHEIFATGQSKHLSYFTVDIWQHHSHCDLGYIYIRGIINSFGCFHIVVKHLFFFVFGDIENEWIVMICINVQIQCSHRKIYLWHLLTLFAFYWGLSWFLCYINCVTCFDSKAWAYFISYFTKF